jgi:2-oxoglutarate dehydrogenase E1 component
MRRNFRKPLIVFTSKKLLRFKPATSGLELFDEGQRFRWLIEDDLPIQNIKHLVFCSG